MKLALFLVSMTYFLGSFCFVSAVKRNIRRLEKTTDSEPVIVGTSIEELEKEEKFLSEEHVHEEHEHDHFLESVDVTDILDGSVVDESKQRTRKTGTVTSFDVVGKGASTPVVDNTVVVVEEDEYPEYPRYGRYYGKGKGGRYGYYNYGYYNYGKGKGGRYYYQGGPRGRVADTTTIVQEQVVVGKGAR